MSTLNASGPAATSPFGRTHHRGRGERSGTGLFLDGSDMSIRGLLESTFSPAEVHGRAHAFAPIPMNALAETLREARDNRNSTHIFPAVKPFGATMPSLGGSGKHARVKSTSSVEGRTFGRLAQTLGALDGGWHRRRSNAEAGGNAVGIVREANHGGHETAAGSGGGGGNNDNDDWDPFAPGGAEAGPAAAGGDAAAATETSIGPGGPGQEAMVRTKSRQLLRAGELSGRDPREAAKLMTKEAFFVEMNASEKHRQNQRRNSHRLPLGRRNSDRGMAAPQQLPPSAFLSSTTAAAAAAAAGAAAAAAGAGSRRHSSMSGTSSGANGVARLSATSGGFAFSCDAKAQRAEIAMILGRRASPMPRTVSFLNRNKSAPATTTTTVAAAAAAAALRAGVQDGEGGRGGARREERSLTDKEVPPLQRRSSGVAAGLTRRFSIRGPDAPGDVQEEENEDEEEDAQQDEKREDEQRL